MVTWPLWNHLNATDMPSDGTPVHATIQAQFDAAAPGTRHYLGPGVYGIGGDGVTGGLTIPGPMDLTGSGMDRTILRALPGIAGNDMLTFRAVSARCYVADLALDCNFIQVYPIATVGAADIIFERVLVTHFGIGPLYSRGASVHGDGDAAPSVRIHFKHCIFRDPHPNCIQAICVGSSGDGDAAAQQVTFEECVIDMSAMSPNGVSAVGKGIVVQTPTRTPKNPARVSTSVSVLRTHLIGCIGAAILIDGSAADVTAAGNRIEGTRADTAPGVTTADILYADYPEPGLRSWASGGTQPDYLVNLTIRENTILGGDGSGIYMVNASKARGLRLVDNHIADKTSVSGGFGIYLDGLPATIARGNTTIGCRYGVAVHGSGAYLDGHVARRCTLDGIYIAPDAADARITAPTSEANGNNGITNHGLRTQIVAPLTNNNGGYGIRQQAESSGAHGWGGTSRGNTLGAYLDQGSANTWDATAPLAV